MGNQSRAAKGRGLTPTGQRVVPTKRPVPRSVAPRPNLRTRMATAPAGASERERALRHLATSAHGRRSKNPNVLDLMKKIRDAIQKLSAERRNKSG
jgi:hypothetical protein